MSAKLALGLGLLASLLAAPSGAAGAGADARPATAPPATPAATPARAPIIIFLGDSLTSGFHLPPDQAYPALVGAALARLHIPTRVINAGVNGDTTEDALAHLDPALAVRPDLMVVALGLNDSFDGRPAEAIAANLRTIVTRARAAGARVLLAGMRLGPTFGAAAYRHDFDSLYPALAHELDVPLIPDLLAGVADDPTLLLRDGIHPNAAGHRKVGDTVLPPVRELVEAIARKSGR